MRIVNLIENTEGSRGCIAGHGLSFYVETENHKLLLDLGPSEDTLLNATKLDIDLSSVDTVILSHGHYDHSGGILPFTELNERAVIYMQESAAGDYYADEGIHTEKDRYRYIGIDKKIGILPQLIKVSGNHRIDDELFLFQIRGRTHELPFTNKNLLIKKDFDFIRDDFRHEQYLVISAGGMHILMSGCAHNGILGILDEYRNLYGSAPDLVISGFHLMKKTEFREKQVQEIQRIAEELKTFPTRFITCHCTGIPAYEIMKEILGEQLDYMHSGDEVLIAHS